MSSPTTATPSTARDAISQTLASSGHLDMSAILYEGKPIFNVDLDSLEDKPWRKPGADITDFFNYGFDENLWRLYCVKQKALRDEGMALRKIHVRPFPFKPPPTLHPF